MVAWTATIAQAVLPLEDEGKVGDCSGGNLEVMGRMKAKASPATSAYDARSNYSRDRPFLTRLHPF